MKNNDTNKINNKSFGYHNVRRNERRYQVGKVVVYFSPTSSKGHGGAIIQNRKNNLQTPSFHLGFQHVLNMASQESSRLFKERSTMNLNSYWNLYNIGSK